MQKFKEWLADNAQHVLFLLMTLLFFAAVIWGGAK